MPAYARNDYMLQFCLEFVLLPEMRSQFIEVFFGDNCRLSTLAANNMMVWLFPYNFIVRATV